MTGVGGQALKALGPLTVRIAVAVAFAAGFCSALPTHPAGAISQAPRSVTISAHSRIVIEPADPARPPELPPAILPTVTCVRRSHHQIETVFGYEHNGVRSYQTPQDGEGTPLRGNYFLDGSRQITDLGQLDQFLPGSHTSRFSVRTSRRATWVLEVPSLAEEAPNSIPPPRQWKISITARGPSCRRSVPRHFASMRATAPDFAPVDVVRDDTGRITRYSLGFTQDGITLCSAGGTPVEPRVLWGYSGSALDGGLNLVPLPPDQVVRIDQFESRLWPRTAVAEREVADISQGVGLEVIVDTYARCQFGDDIVEAPDPRWGGDDGSSFLVFVKPNQEIHIQVFVPAGGVRFR